MICYHGTKKEIAKSIIGPPKNIDVTLGKGELGRGFYAGENLALAASFAAGKFGNKEKAILEINIKNSDFVKLNIKSINRQTLIYKHWQTLIRNKETNTFLYGVDVIVAPFATLDFSHQYKFESFPVQKTLNNSKVTIL